MYAEQTLVLFTIIAAITFAGPITLNAVPVFATNNKSFIAKLAGHNEVPPKDTKATGNFEIVLSADGTISNYVLNVTNISNVKSAQMQQAQNGTNGPIVATLYNSTNPSTHTNGILSKGTVFSAQFEGPLAGKYISDLMRLIIEGKVYANVDTTQNPKGEIRGQLSNATS